VQLSAIDRFSIRSEARIENTLARRNPRRGQLSATSTVRATAFAIVIAWGSLALADDRAEVSTQLFAEQRDGGKGGLTVVHPQFDFGIDLGRFVSLDVAYSADAVSGATSAVYQVDAVSSATKFSDLRNEVTVGLGFHGRRSRITFGATVGTERDYVTRQVGGNASIDLPGRNTTVGLAYSHSFDQVCDKDNGMATPLESKALVGADTCQKSALIAGKDLPGMTIWKDLAIDTAQATLTQNLSPTMNLQLAGYGQILDGFQSNPYRRVRIGPNAPQEHIPDIRARWSLSARINRFLPALRAAVHLDTRFYDDTWGVIGGNVEMGYSQYVGKSLLLRFHARVYQQSAAKFFKDAFYYQTESTAGEYFTGDRELSPVRNATLGAKLTLITVGGDKPVWGLFDKLQLTLRGDILMIDVLPADNLAENAGGIDKQFIYGNSLIDAVILQLGLHGNY
jgi:hypothetical protein